MANARPKPEEQVPEEATVAAETPAAEPKKPAAKKKPARKRKPAAKKAAPKKPTAEKKPEEAPEEEPKVPTAKEIKEQFVEAAVEPTKKAALVWADVVDVAKEGFSDLKELAVGIGAGFLGTKKKDQD